MSLFEDLIDELKEDNLLEETVIESVQAAEKSKETAVAEAKAENPIPQDLKEDELSGEDPSFNTEENDGEPIVVESENIVVAVDESISTLKAEVVEEIDEDDLIQEETLVADEIEPAAKVFKPSKTELDEREFYRRRALDEVNGLEMVDHVLTGVEREMMKIIPKSYENYDVKQALHEFLQVVDDVKSSEHAELEFMLMQETEQWYSALSERDQKISVADLRRYCETTKPSLSSQALMSLARFYRNSPYSETIRSKFDLVVSKLFTKDIKGDRREMLFEAEDLVKHIQELYADWSSTPLYSTDDDDSELLLAALKFQDFISEAENAESFDELVKKDFFKRLKTFKEKSNENFFAPILVAAAVECNVVVGNKFIDLIGQVRDDSQSGSLTDKYGNVHDKSISDATSKTLELLNILEVKKADGADADDDSETTGEDGESGKAKSTYAERRKNNSLFGANKWLVIATAATMVLALIYFVFFGSASTLDSEVEVSKNVKIVNLENSSLKEYVESARINKSTMFAITKPNWDERAFKEKEEIVEKFLKTGEEKGFSKVHFLNGKGETVAFGSKDGINVIQ